MNHLERVRGWERVWGALIDASARLHATLDAYRETPHAGPGVPRNARWKAWNKVKGAILSVHKAHRAAIRWCEDNNEHIPDWLVSVQSFR